MPQAIGSTDGEARVELADDAPDKHVVVRGDTLWDISATFLKSPWRWPEVWQLNREQIANPHLIYPGDIVYLDTSGASPRLRLGRPSAATATPAASGGAGQGRLEPVVRAEQLGQGRHLHRFDGGHRSLHQPAADRRREGAVPSRRGSSRPRKAGSTWAAATAPTCAASRTTASATGTSTVRPSRCSIPTPASRSPTRRSTSVPRRWCARAIRPPSGIVGNAEEIGEGDRLVPAEAGAHRQFRAPAPERDVAGKIISVYRGMTPGRAATASSRSTSARSQGLEVGHVLTVQLTGQLAKDRETNETGQTSE